MPLARHWGTDVTSVGVIATHVVRSDGADGWGFSWTPQIGAEAVAALLQNDIARAAVGRPARPGVAWQGLWEHLHEAGGGGITTIALAGLDLALWDAEARQAAAPLSTVLGCRRERVRTYGSGVNLHYSLEELLSQVRRWIDAGFGAVKIKDRPRNPIHSCRCPRISAPDPDPTAVSSVPSVNERGPRQKRPP